MAEEIYIARQDTLLDAKTELTEVNTKIGTTANTGGNATAGTLMGKLNALLTNWTAARATKVDTIDTNVSSVKSTASTINTNVTSVKTSVGTAADTGGSATAGTLMGKSNAIITALGNLEEVLDSL